MTTTALTDNITADISTLWDSVHALQQYRSELTENDMYAIREHIDDLTAIIDTLISCQPATTQPA